MIETSSPDPLLDRRRFLRRAMEIGAILPTLAACRGPGSIIEPPSIHPRAAAPERPSDEESSRVEGIPHDLLAIPDFSRVGRFVAGIRPFRRPGVRIERETLADGRPLVHHYGHGGAGVTVSWGTAEIAADRVEEATDGPRAITVLGAGVIGLSTASVLRERGHEVRIVAAKFLSETTFLAGAQWAPSWIKVTEGLSATLRRAHLRFAALEGAEWGVFRRPNYTRDRKSAVFRIPEGLFPPAAVLDRLPFPGPDRAGFVQETFLIEPPIYLPRLQRELEDTGVSFERVSIEHRQELERLGGDVLVNCLGLGAGSLFEDAALQPVRGQLIHLSPGHHPYLLSHWGYVFPRRDAVLLGGTFEPGVADATPDERTCQRLLARHARFFENDTVDP